MIEVIRKEVTHWRLNVKVNLEMFYWDEVMGPLSTYSNSKFKLSDEDLLMLLSTVEPYLVSTESSISGPTYNKNQIIMSYNRSVNNPDATDERISLMGADCWVLISCKKENELVLLSKIEIIKMILDIEFNVLEEVNQMNPAMGERADFAISKVYQD